MSYVPPMYDHLDKIQMEDFLQKKFECTEEESKLIAEALQIPWRHLIFMADAEITRRLEHMDAKFTAGILNYLHTNYKNRGSDGKHKVPCRFVRQANGTLNYG